jgi:hypothetical protein
MIDRWFTDEGCTTQYPTLHGDATRLHRTNAIMCCASRSMDSDRTVCDVLLLATVEHPLPELARTRLQHPTRTAKLDDAAGYLQSPAEQEFRFDALKQDSTTDIYGAGRGLDIIPAERVQIVLGAPSYVVHHGSESRDGIGDLPLLLKYRVASKKRLRSLQTSERESGFREADP